MTAKANTPDCPLCGKLMVRRTAKRGQNHGNQFWGCPNYPKCKGTIYDDQAASITNEASIARYHNGRAKPQKHHSQEAAPNEPDAAGHWDPNQRREILNYLYERDGGRCGICGVNNLKLEEAQVEHIVPKVFGYFDIQKGGKAKIGSYYKSLLHDNDNLQAAHKYCNKHKGNKADTRQWRHPLMPPLVVAVAKDDRKFVVPFQGK